MPRVTITQLHEATAGTASLLAVTRLAPDRVVTAVRTASGDLKVIVWDVGGDGAITRRGDAAGGPVSRISMTDWPEGPGVVTAVRDSDNNLKVIAWKVGGNGNVTRAGDASAGTIHEVAISSPSGFTGVVTPVVNGSKHLEVIAWKLNSAGQFTRTDSNEAGDCSKVAATSLSATGGLARVAIGVRNGSGDLELIIWTISASGHLTRKGEVTAGSITDVALSFRGGNNADLFSVTTGADGQLTAIGWAMQSDGTLKRLSTGRGGTATSPAVTMFHPDIHTYAVGALRDEGGHLKLIVWRNGTDLTRHGEHTGSAISQVVVTPWSDGVVTAAVDGGSDLRLTSWRLRPAGIRLLKQEWVMPSTSPAAGTDALFASSPDAPSDASLARRPRALRQLDTAPPPGPDGDDGTNDSPAWKKRFFPSVGGVDPMIAVGHNFVVVTQDHQIAFYDRDGNLLKDSGGNNLSMSATTFFHRFIEATNPDGTTNQNNINLISPLEIKEFYDTRVTYDAASKCFVILSAARKQIGTPPPRYFAFAVSKTQDPRDGFFQYMTTESNYRDFPRLVVHNGTIFQSHNAEGLADEGETPVLYGFDLASARQGLDDLSNWLYYPSDLDGAERVFSVLHHGNTAGLTMVVDIRRGDPVLRMIAFAAPSHPWLAPEPTFVSHTLGSQAPSPGPCMTFRDNTLVISGSITITDRVPNQQPPRFSVRVIRIPFSQFSTGGLAVNAGGVVDHFFGKNAPTDAPNDLVSYDKPHSAVNSLGDMIFVYGRTGVVTAQQLKPEVRYSVWVHGENTQRRSALLQAGTWWPTWIYDDGDASTPAETTPTVITHAYQLDYATAVVDPKDDKTFWVIHEYADGTTSSWKTVIGVVDPTA
jgi:hypothetical protein